MVDVTLIYKTGDDLTDSEWLFTDKDGKEIQKFTQPDLKKVFQAGYDYALKHDVDFHTHPN